MRIDGALSGKMFVANKDPVVLLEVSKNVLQVGSEDVWLRTGSILSFLGWKALDQNGVENLMSTLVSSRDLLNGLKAGIKCSFVVCVLLGTSFPYVSPS